MIAHVWFYLFTISNKGVIYKLATSITSNMYNQKKIQLFFEKHKNAKMFHVCVSKKKTHVSLEKSSIRTKTRRFSLRLLVLVRPNKSICINSRDLDIIISLIDLKEDLVCFLSWHASQMRSFSVFKLGMSFTIFLELIRDRWSKET